MLILFFAAGTFCIQSCGPGNTDTANDAVEQAMDQNEEAMDHEGSMGVHEDDDTEFAVKAASGGLTQVKAGEVAQQKAKDQRVRDFAAKMVQDHTKVNEELRAIAANKNITLPAAPGEDELEDIGDLNSYTGIDFDKHFMNMMVDEHQDAIDLFEDAAEDAEDADLKAFASNALSSLRMHLEEAKILKDALN